MARGIKLRVLDERPTRLKTPCDDEVSFITGEYIPTVPSSAKDHSTLINRDLDDQHPLSAITGLLDALNSKIDANLLALVATSGLIDDLSQQGDLILYCGTSTEVM